MVSDKLSVGELMTTQMTALEPVMLVSKLEGVLRRCAHQAFPITNEVEKAFAASECSSHKVDRAFAATQCARLLVLEGCLAFETMSKAAAPIGPSPSLMRWTRPLLPVSSDCNGL